MVTDLKTTISGIVAASAVIAQGVGVSIPTEVTTGVSALALFLIGLFAKDK